MAILQTTRPIAETFYVSSQLNPQGVYISSVDLCFQKVETARSLPVIVEIRPTENGIPVPKTIIPGAQCTRFGNNNLNNRLGHDIYAVPADKFPNFDDGSVYSRFVFPSPVYLIPGEYALVIRGTSSEYVTYIATLGANQIVADGATPTLITQQPYAGKLFRAQTRMGGEWLPRDDQDLMFRLNRCSFSTTGVDSVANLRISKKTGRYSATSTNRNSLVRNFSYDEFYLRADDLSPSGGSVLSYSYVSKPVGSSISQTYKKFNPNYNTYIGSRQEIVKDGDTTPDFAVAVSMSTNTNKIAPVLDESRVGLIAIKNVVNNAEISNNDFVIVSGGAGYAEGDTINVISVKSGTFGANDAVWENETFTVNATGGVITGIFQREGRTSGTKYLDSPLANVNSATATTIADIRIHGETNSHGGNAKARYITKTVTLAEGFDANDIRVFLTAHKPLGTHIGVYYKVKSSDDGGKIEDNDWVLMKQKTPESIASVSQKASWLYTDIEYAPYDYENSDNPISYKDTYGRVHSSFKQFKIKIVMITDNTTRVPKIKNLRAIALE